MVMPVFSYQEFCIRLNAELTDLSHRDIGIIPLSNLELELPVGMKEEELADALTNDGLKTVVYRFSDGNDLYVQIP